MRVLQVGSNSIHVSGYVKAMAENVDEQYLLVEEICGFEGISKEYQVSFRKLNPIAIWRNYQNTKKIIRRLSPDLIHIHQINRLGYLVSRIARKLHVPVVSTAWGGDVLLMPLKNRFFKFLVSNTLKHSRFATADSQEMLNVMEGLCPTNEQKYKLLQYGIDPIEPQTKQKIIFSNRLHKPLYRIDLIIDLFSVFVVKNPEWKLVIGAIGDETENLKVKVANLNLKDSVEFVGWLEKSDNEHWYAISQIYVSLPTSDGTSVSLLEAMSAACIPIVTDLLVSKEWIQNGVNGIVYSDAENPFEQALKLDRDKLFRKNKQLVDEKASRRSNIEEFFKLYKALVNEK